MTTIMHLEPCETSTVELFAETVTALEHLAVFSKIPYCLTGCFTTTYSSQA